MTTTLDLRAHDAHEHGLTLTERVAEVAVDLQLAQRIRDALRDKREAEAFEAADKRMRGGL